MNEAQLTDKVIVECRVRRLLVHHCHDSRRCEGTPGMPDLLIASARGVLFAELKDDDGVTSADQDRWLYTLHVGGVPYVVWRPRDWESGAIQRRLSDLAGP
jgi:hypothetical protein